MGYAGLTVFLLFFGVGVLDAFAGGHWVRGMFWLLVGAAFWGFDRIGRRRQTGGGEKPDGPG